MDPAILSALAEIGNTGKAGVADVLDRLVQRYGERASTAQARHEQQRVVSGDPLDTKRDELIRQINRLQSDAALYIASANADFQQRILILLMEHCVAAYEATASRELDLVKAGVDQAEAALQGYFRQRKGRRQARMAAVAVCVLGMVSLGLFLWVAGGKGITSTSRVVILDLPVSVLLWSVIGSYASILYRFTHAGDAEIQDPIRWLVARPLTGIIMGAITYLIIRVGVVALAPETASAESAAAGAAGSLGGNEVIWLTAFLAGFSDRFSDALLRGSIGKLGGEKDGEIMNVPEAPAEGAARGAFGHLGDYLLRKKQAAGGDAPRTPGEVPAPEANREVNVGAGTRVVSEEGIAPDAKASAPPGRAG